VPSGFCIFSDLLYEFRRIDVVSGKIADNQCFGFWWENGNRDAEIVTNSLRIVQKSLNFSVYTLL
jgi:hypothetical protein